MLKKGIIVSIQGYHYKTISELAKEAINAGCIGIRTDKKLTFAPNKDITIIGLRKKQVPDVKKESYITDTVEEISQVNLWADFIAVDYRRCNPRLKELSDFAAKNKLKIIADIETIDDYKNIKSNNYFYSYVATTLSVFKNLFNPDLKLVEQLAKAGEKNIIAEGNFTKRFEVKNAFDLGAHAVCIGGVISDVYKLTKKFTSVL